MAVDVNANCKEMMEKIGKYTTTISEGCQIYTRSGLLSQFFSQFELASRCELSSYCFAIVFSQLATWFTQPRAREQMLYMWPVAPEQISLLTVLLPFYR